MCAVAYAAVGLSHWPWPLAVCALMRAQIAGQLLAGHVTTC